LLARTGFALAPLLGATHIRFSVPYLWIDAMRSRTSPRKHRIRTSLEPNDIRRLSRDWSVRHIRDWHTLVRTTPAAPNRRSSQDQAGIQPVARHRGHR
jgi:hypothetical protein